MDAEAERLFREFVDARSFALRRVAYALTGDLHRAEDLVQEAMTKLAGRWGRVDNPEGYVRRIVYRDNVSWWRRHSNSRETPSSELPDRIVPDGADDVHRKLDLRSALGRLTPRQRAVLILKFYEDLPEREVADVLGCSVGTVRSQTAKALARLRQGAPELEARSTSTAKELSK